MKNYLLKDISTFNTNLCLCFLDEEKQPAHQTVIFFSNSFIVQRLFTLVQKQGFQNCSL